ncbi:MAG TPA: ribonuclease Y [Phycisphaerae bacterium]|nr:ribonuclease Y [Phycisphaerae bacterium]HNU46659.1 ribonuclease Y [Phycisphaerae bacterium]
MNTWGILGIVAQSAGSYVAWVLVGLVVGGGGLYLLERWLGKARLRAARQEADVLLSEAKTAAEVVRKTAEVEAKEEHLQQQEQIRKEAAEMRAELKETEKRLAKREDSLEAKMDTLATKERNLEQAEAKIATHAATLEKKEREVETVLSEQRAQLLRVSGMTAEEARRTVLNALSMELEHEKAELVERTVTTAREEAAARSRDITLTAIQRYAAEHTSEATVAAIDIPTDEMKGRVIGREGRNIRAFERATGVDVIVDDTPGVVVVSAFDPVRREIARVALERLIHDGRIHPGRIEELVEQVRKEVEAEILETGKKAALDASVGGLQRKQLDLLGRLKYRTSYGQNVLQHSMEVAFLCQIIADELGLDGRLARRCGLLHDVGKAIDHEVEGAHPKIGADFCRRFNERPEVLNAIEGHHGDVPATSPYTAIVMAADAISASRPGSRRESLERYIQRLQQLEEIAKVHAGVTETYAIQAGREIRVIVDAKRVDDALAEKIARDVALDVERQLTYPGEIRVTVLREVRAMAVAR